MTPDLRPPPLLAAGMVEAGNRLVIFDCDGVLIDSEPVACEVLATTLARYGIQIDAAHIAQSFLGASLGSLIAHYATLGVQLPDGFKTELDEALRQEFERSLQPVSGVRHLLDGLTMPICVASSSHLERVRHALELTGLAQYFGERIFTAEMVAHGKPAPDLFRLAATTMGAAPKDVLVIEDSRNGVQAARAAQMEVWGFIGGGHYRSDPVAADRLFEAGAARVFSSMTELEAQLRVAPEPA